MNAAFIPLQHDALRTRVLVHKGQTGPVGPDPRERLDEFVFRHPQEDCHLRQLHFKLTDWRGRPVPLTNSWSFSLILVQEDEEVDIPILEIGNDAEKLQRDKLIKLRASRDENAVQKSLNQISESCKNDNNIMQPIIDAAKRLATMGEIVIAMKAEFGEWQETAVF